MHESGNTILFAAGGTGGHLFPAQALALSVRRQDAGIQLLFAGAGLNQNPYFDKASFAFRQIQSASLFQGNPWEKIRKIGTLLCAIKEGMTLLSKEKPSLIVGFGSYHTFPILSAAYLKKIPMVLFESNVVPGKVIRLFSKAALFTAVQFQTTQEHLPGKTVVVDFPFLNSEPSVSAEVARLGYQLDPKTFTLLICGGSQGAKRINAAVAEWIPLLAQAPRDIQLLHMTGDPESTLVIQQLCQKHQIRACIQTFEKQMHRAWSAADIVLGRAGAATLAELIQFQVPAILVPYPHAAEAHQLKNAKWLEQHGGGVVLEEKELTAEGLHIMFLKVLQDQVKMEKALCDLKQQQRGEDLSSLIIGLTCK